MLWKNLILCINRYAREHPQDKGSRELWRQAKEKDTIPLHCLVHHFEPVHVEVLRSVIPNGFPKKLRTCPLIVEKNIHGQWRVRPADSP